MADPEVVIKISAKDLTSEGFAAARKQIAGLADEAKKSGKETADVFDRIKDAIESPTGALKEFGGVVKEGISGMGEWAAIGVGVAGVAVAIGAAMAEMAKEFVETGARFNDFSEKTSMAVEDVSKL